MNERTMNERIQALAVQAEDYADGIVDQGGEFHEAYTQRLAELIVRECVTVLDQAQWDKGEDWVCADGRRIIAQVKHHFGVE